MNVSNEMSYISIVYDKRTNDTSVDAATSRSTWSGRLSAPNQLHTKMVFQLKFPFEFRTKNIPDDIGFGDKFWFWIFAWFQCYDCVIKELIYWIVCRESSECHLLEIFVRVDAGWHLFECVTRSQQHDTTNKRIDSEIEKKTRAHTNTQ